MAGPGLKAALRKYKDHAAFMASVADEQHRSVLEALGWNPKTDERTFGEALDEIKMLSTPWWRRWRLRRDQKLRDHRAKIEAADGVENV